MEMKKIGAELGIHFVPNIFELINELTDVQVSMDDSEMIDNTDG